MTLITFQDGAVVFRDGQVGTEQECCCCKQGPWCVSVAWDLEYDDVNDGLPPVALQGSAVVWVNEDSGAVDYAVRKCLDGAAANDAPFTDAGCNGFYVSDFCDALGYINYGGIAQAVGGCLDFTFEFAGLNGDSFVLHTLTVNGDTLTEGITNVDESYDGANRTLTGTVTFSVSGGVEEGDCGCP